MGANAPEGGPAEGEPLDGDSVEGAPGSLDSSDLTIGSETAGAGQSADATEMSDPANRSAAALARRLSEPFLRLPGVAQAVKRRREAKSFAELEEQALRHHSQKDSAANEATRLPDGERLRMPAIWVAEVFTPTTVSNLVEGIRGLAVKMGQSPESSTEVLDWILSSRRLGESDSRDVLYVRPKNNSVKGRTAVEQTPPGIKYIHLQLITLTSTVTVLIAKFGLDEDRERQLEGILNQDRTTQVRRNSDGTLSPLNVASLKTAAADNWQISLRRDATRWMTERFQGFFSRVSPDQLPSMALMLTKDYVPWHLRVLLMRVDWASILYLAGPRGCWEANDLYSLRLQPVTRGMQRHCFTLAVSESGIRSSLRLEADQADQADQIDVTGLLDLSVPSLLAICCMPALLGELNEQISGILDAANHAGLNRSVKALETVQHQLLQAGIDNRIVANDISQNSSRQTQRFRLSVPDFHELPRKGYSNTPATSLIDAWRADQDAMAERVIQRERDLREVLSTNANLVSASANLRLQSRVFWLTVISGLATIIGTFAAVYAISHPSASNSPASVHSTPPSHSASAAPHARASLMPLQTRRPDASGTTGS